MFKALKKIFAHEHRAKLAISEKTIPLESFRSLSICADAKVRLRVSSGEHKIIIRAPLPVFKRLRVGVNRYGVLDVFCGRIERLAVADLEIEIWVEKIESIYGRGHLVLESPACFVSREVCLEFYGRVDGLLNFSAAKIISEIKGAGVLKMVGIASSHLLALDGSVKLDASLLKTQNLDARVQGPCVGRFDVQREAVVSAYGLSRISIAGNPKEVRKIAELAYIGA